MTLIQGLMEWTENTFAPLGAWGLFILAFMESSFFPVPPDVLLIILTLAEPANWIFLAIVCTIGSILGAMLGYGIGYVGEEVLLKRFVSQKKIDKVHKFFDKYEGWAMFIAGFTPIPFKIFTISAGVFYVNIRQFIIASLIGRAMRFFIVAGLVAYFGRAVVSLIDKYFNIVSIIFVIVLVIIVWAYKKVKRT